MAAPSDLFVIDRDSILAYQQPAYQLPKEGEWGRITVRTARGPILFDSGELPLLGVSSTKAEVSVCSNRFLPLRMYLTYRILEDDGYAVTRTFLVPLQGKTNWRINQKIGCVKLVFFKEDEERRASLASTIQLARREAAAVRKAATVTKSRGSSGSSQRPNEYREGSVVKRKYETFPPGKEWTFQTVLYPIYQRDWTGVRTPNFANVKKGDLPVNPHSVSLRHTGTKPTSYVTQAFWWGFNYFIDAPFFGQSSPQQSMTWWSDLPSHNAKAGNKALSRLVKRTGGQLDANLAQDLAQLGQLGRLVTNSTARIGGAYKHLRKGNIPGAIKAFWVGREPRFRKGSKGPIPGATLANNWLELQYGWKPLLNDIKGTIEAISRFNLQGVHFVATASASVTEDDSFPYRRTTSGVSHDVGFAYETCRSSTKYGIRYGFDSHLVAFLAQTGFTNPLNLAWEVLPFSFVADWLLPIGPYLETLSGFHGLEFLDGYKVEFTRRRRSCYYDTQIPGVSGPGFFDTYKGQAYGMGLQFNRTKLTAWPTATRPQFKNPFSLTHAANSVALLIALMGGHKIHRIRD